ncbi:MAG: hypothetical protein ACR2NM_13285 [Bythopirellula sp.]
MNRSLLVAGRLAVALFALLLPGAVTQAQSEGYQAPNFAGISGAQFHQAQAIPSFPASPLAGGPAAVQGGEFMDVQGNPIVLPTNYCSSCPDGGCMDGGYGAPCYGAPCYGGCPGGYGDPMAVDFGGYAEDQVGPHYFDVSASAVFLQASELFNGVGAFTSAGVGLTAPRFLNPNTSDDDYEPGWQIVGRLDVGALSVLEVSYMGLYDIGFTDSIDSLTATQSVPGGPFNFSLESVYSDYGTNGAVFPIPGIDDAQTHAIDYQSDLQSTEISYRRYWVGNNPRVSGTCLVGARYLRMTEEFNFNSVGLVNGGLAPANRLYSSENDMVGFQFGGDGWIGLRQGLRVGAEAKAGVYNNHFKFRHAATLPGTPDFDVLTVSDQVAFAGEGGATIVADILPSLSVRGGYRVLYLNSIATAGSSISSNLYSTVVGNQGHALYHGFDGGIEYVW